jgi:hypothetical protein
MGGSASLTGSLSAIEWVSSTVSVPIDLASVVGFEWIAIECHFRREHSRILNQMRLLTGHTDEAV